MKKFKLFLIVVASFIGMAIIIDSFDTDSSGEELNLIEASHSPSQLEIDFDSINKVVISEVKKETKVMDAVITDANVLYVSVRHDGTNRNGFASYFCNILSEHGSKANMVKIIAYGTTKHPERDNAYGVLLGESRCN